MSTVHHDYLRPFGVEDTSISGHALCLGDSLTAILSQHQYPRMVSDLLTQLIALTALLQGSFKSQGLLTLQIKGDGLIDTLMCDVDHVGALRAYAHFNESLKDEDVSVPGDLKSLVGEGYLLLVLDPEEGARYQGVVALKGHTLTECVEHYFTQSVQHPTKIALAVEEPREFFVDTALSQADRFLSKGMGQWKVGAVMVQQHSDGYSVDQLQNEWEEVSCLMETIAPQELLATDEAHLDGLLFRLFHEHGVRVHDALPLHAQCRCSQEKIQTAVNQAYGVDGAVGDLCETAAVTCEFCGRVYDILLPPLASS